MLFGIKVLGVLMVGVVQLWSTVVLGRVHFLLHVAANVGVLVLRSVRMLLVKAVLKIAWSDDKFSAHFVIGRMILDQDVSVTTSVIVGSRYV